jgi:hypothetical protein
MNCLMSQQHWSLIVTCYSGTLQGSPANLVVNATPNKEPPMSSALLGLPKAPKALLFQHTEEETQYGGSKVIVTDFWFCPDDIECCVKGSKCS